jgi:hypothetical protein
MWTFDPPRALMDFHDEASFFRLIQVDQLKRGPRIPLTSFADEAPELGVLKSHLGVYAIWDETAGPAMLLYVGMVGTVPDTQQNRERFPLIAGAPNPALGRARRAAGLVGRLRDHAKYPSELLWLYYAERFILPDLPKPELERMREGKLHLEDLIRDKLREKRLTCQTVATVSRADASRLERALRKYGLPGSGPPLLNPLTVSTVK